MSDASQRTRPAHFSTDSLDAGEALKRAHELAFAPYTFMAAIILRDTGLLQRVLDMNGSGVGMDDLAEISGMPDNSAHVLLEAGLAGGLLYRLEDRLYITKAGHFFLTNETIRTNASFMQDVCLPGILELKTSLSEGRPAGLEALGSWKNIFKGLDTLPQPAKDSWYAFNNHHSEAGFRDALPMLFEHKPARILDIGGSTGRFALACLDHDQVVQLGVADICIDVERMEPGVKAAVRTGRITLHPMDVLSAAADLPAGYDTIWMSQFLPCFSEDQVMEILAKCHKVLPRDGYVYIMETFWDKQRQQAAAAALQLTSLYFVNIATGISRMWSSEDLARMITTAGFNITDQKNNIGRGHTLMELRKT